MQSLELLGLMFDNGSSIQGHGLSTRVMGKSLLECSLGQENTQSVLSVTEREPVPPRLAGESLCFYFYSLKKIIRPIILPLSLH